MQEVGVEEAAKHISYVAFYLNRPGTEQTQTSVNHSLPARVSLPSFGCLLLYLSDVLVFLPLAFLLGENNSKHPWLSPAFSLYKELAWETGFEEFHLHLRPVPFESVPHKDKVDQQPAASVTSAGGQ